MKSLLSAIKANHLLVFCLLASIICSARMLHGMEELPLLANDNNSDFDRGLLDQRSVFIEDLQNQKKQEWYKTLAWGAGALISMGGGITLVFMVSNSNMLGILGGSFLATGSIYALIARGIVHVKKTYRIQSIADYLASLDSDAQEYNDQKLLVSKELLQSIASEIYTLRSYTSNNLKTIIKDYRLWQLFPTEDSIDRENRRLSLMTFLLSLKRRGYDKKVNKDIRYKIIAYCPEFICNQQLFNLAVLHMKQDAQCADFIRYCPFSWIKAYFQEKCKEDEVFADQIATVGTELFANTMYELLPDKDLNNQETFGTRAKVDKYVYDELKEALHSTNDSPF